MGFHQCILEETHFSKKKYEKTFFSSQIVCNLAKNYRYSKKLLANTPIINNIVEFFKYHDNNFNLPIFRLLDEKGDLELLSPPGILSTAMNQLHTTLTVRT